jgi:hypothetical protein
VLREISLVLRVRFALAESLGEATVLPDAPYPQRRFQRRCLCLLDLDPQFPTSDSMVTKCTLKLAEEEKDGKTKMRLR